MSSDKHAIYIPFLEKKLKEGILPGVSDDFSISFFKKGGGNLLYLIETIEKKYIARINDYAPKNEWQVKAHEEKVLLMLSGKNIAPEIYFLDDSESELHQHYNIIEYIEGETLETVSNHHAKQLAQVLKKLHKSFAFDRAGDSIPPEDELPYECEIFDEFSGGEDKNIEKYSELSGIKEVIPLYQETEKRLGDWFHQLSIFNGISEFCLCHADLKKENIIVTPNDEVFLIDWEYSGVDIPETDIGRLFSGCQFSDEQLELFLKEYYGKAPEEIVRKRIMAVKTVLDFFRIIEDFILLKRLPWNAEQMKSRLLVFSKHLEEIGF